MRIGASTARGISSTMYADVAEDAAEADEQAGEQRVAGARAHPLVRRLADVRRGLRDAAAHAGDQRRHRLGEQDVAGLEVVAGDARALGDVDAADHGEQRERDRRSAGT